MRETFIRIKSRGYDVVIDNDFDTPGDFVSEMLRDYDGGFEKFAEWGLF